MLSVFCSLSVLSDRRPFYFTLIRFILIWLTVPTVKADELVFAQLIFRHGERTPLETFKNDPNRNAWPQGFGELTELGMQQQFDFGKQLRKMYIEEHHLLSYAYNPNEVGNPFSDCEYQLALQNKLMKSAGWLALENEHKSLMDSLTDLCGEEINFDNLWIPYEALTIAKTTEKHIPRWADARILALMKHLSDIQFDMITGLGYGGNPFNKEIVKIRGGSLLKSVVDLMLQKVDCAHRKAEASCNWINRLKLYTYSVDDAGIAAFLAAVIRQNKPMVAVGVPEITSAIHVELWNSTTMGLQVKILYHPRPGALFSDITSLVPKCPGNNEMCPLNFFTTSAAEFIPADIETFCAHKPERPWKK